MSETKNSAEKPAKINIELKEINAIAKELGIDTAVLAGVKAMKKWKNGKEVTADEMSKAVSEFLNKTC